MLQKNEQHGSLKDFARSGPAVESSQFLGGSREAQKSLITWWFHYRQAGSGNLFRKTK